MVTPYQIRANRINSLRSTGPRTAAGRARAAQNAVKAGLFSRLLVLPTLGESAEEYEAFRTAVVADQVPVGAIERELADRVAGLMWRLRRVARYEAAAMAVAVGELPPHPDAVQPLNGNGVLLPVPPGATVVYRLSHLRARTLGPAEAVSSRRAAVDTLTADADERDLVDVATAGRVFDAATDELGWVLDPDPWHAALAAAGFEQPRVSSVEWTVGRVNEVLSAAAGTTSRSLEDFRNAVRERLRAAAAEYEGYAAEGRAEEARLAAELLAERERQAGTRTYGDDGLVQRVARAEAHLSRELDRTLLLLARCRADQNSSPAAARAVGFALSDRDVRVSPVLPKNETG